MHPTTIPDLSKYRNVIFDLDGTLVDSMDLFDEAFSEVMARHGIPYQEAFEYVNATVHSQTEEQVTELFARRGQKLDHTQFKAIEDAILMNFASRPAPFFSGAQMLVEELVSRKKQVFLSSHCPDRIVLQRLDAGDIRHLFRLILGKTFTPKGPQHVARILMASRHDEDTFRSSTVMIGDRVSDITMAREAGLDAIGVRGSMPDADLLNAGAMALVPDMAALLAMLP